MNQHDKAPHTLGRDLPILIDGFRFANPDVQAYFLSHFHSDHYSALDEDFPWENKHGAKLYCSPVTAALAEHTLHVKPARIVAVPFDTEVEILVAGQTLKLVLISANHCPGSAMLLFTLPGGRKVLHTGDMRFSPAMLESPHLKAAAASTVSSGRIDEIFLDTTYAHPKHVFQSQAESVAQAAAVVQAVMPASAAFSGDTGDFVHAVDVNMSELRSSSAGAHSAYDSQALLFPSLACAATAKPITVDTESVVGSGAGGPSVECVGPSPSGATAALPAAGKGLSAARVSGPSAAAAMPFSALLTVPAQLPPPTAPGRTDRALVLVCTYVVGKERILVELIRRFRLLVYVPQRKLHIVRRLGLPPEVLRFFTADKAAADVHVMRMDACGRHWMPDYGRMRRYAAGVNRLHALTELGLLQSGSSVAAGVAAAVSNVPPTGAGVTASGAARGDGTTASARGSRRNVEDEADDEDEREEEGAAPAVVDPCGSAGASTSAGSGTGGFISEGSSTDRRATPFVASPWSRLPPDAEVRVAAVPPRYTRVIGIVPTGWVHTSKKKVHVAPCSTAPCSTAPCFAVPGDIVGPAKGDVSAGPLTSHAFGSAASCATASGHMCADQEDSVTAAAVAPARNAAVDASNYGTATPDRLPSSAALDEAAAPSSGGTTAPDSVPTAGAASAFPATSDDRFTWMGAEVYLVPYSEHSSFPELQAFVRALKPRKISPHVYSDAADRDRIVARFSHLLDSTAAKRAFFSAFGSGTNGAGALSDRSSSALAGAAAASQVPLVVASCDDGCKPASGGLARSGETDLTELDDDEDASELLPRTARMEACASSGRAASPQFYGSSRRRGAGADGSGHPPECEPPAAKKARTAMPSPCALRLKAGSSASGDEACDDDVVVVDDDDAESAAGAAAALGTGAPISDSRRRTATSSQAGAGHAAVSVAQMAASAGVRPRLDFHCYACRLDFAAHVSTSGATGDVLCPCGSDFIERRALAGAGQGLAGLRGSAASLQVGSAPAAKASPHTAPGATVAAGRGARIPSKATIGSQADISSFFKH
jgi:hypothetical protein